MMRGSTARMKYDTICIELTTRCALQCVHCSTHAGPGRREFLGLETYRVALGVLGGSKELYLSGGEPFEHPDLLAFADFAATRTERLVIYTSGVILSDEGISPVPQDILNELPRHGVARVDVSLYSASPLEHDDATQRRGSFAATIAFLASLREAAIPFGVHFVPLVSGGARVLEVARLAREVGAVRFHVLALTRQGRATSLCSDLDRAFLADLRAIESVPGFEVVRSSSLRKALGEETTVRDTWRAGFVDVYGTPHPCEGRRLSGKSLLLARDESTAAFAFLGP